MKKISMTILEYLLTLLVILTLNFFIPRMMPGDPFTFVSSEEGSAYTVYSEAEVLQLKAYYGLDKPLLEQYQDYLGNIAGGDFGYSIYFHETVLKLVGGRILYTLPIVLIALFLSCAVGCFLGCHSALKRNRFLDKIAYSSVMAFSQIPVFLIVIFLLFVFGGWLKWVPLSGATTVFADYDTVFAAIGDRVYHAFLPGSYA